MVYKKIILPVVAVAAGGVMLFSVSQSVHAQNTTPFGGLAEAIAQKFGLDKAKVQDVVNQYRSDHKADMLRTMYQRLEDRLSQAVKDGKLNENQKKALLDKLSSLKNDEDNQDFKTMTPQQRRTEMKKERDDLASWAKSQGIDLSVIMPFSGKGMGMHRGFLK